MKRLTKMLSLVICLIISLSTVLAATGCGPEEANWDMTKVNLRVQVYDGGYGNDWLYACKEDFEKKYAETTFGDLKGVDVHITTDRTLGTAIKDQYAVLEQDMMFCPTVHDYVGLAKNGYLLDLTDIFTDVPQENIGTGKTNKSIKDNLEPEVERFLAVQDASGTDRYYGLPCQGEGNGFNYDVDMFFNYGFYYKDGHDHSTKASNFITPIEYDDQDVADNGGEYVTLTDVGGGTMKYVTVKGDTLSTGPDGKYGTNDDGEPEYYSDFLNLCHYMQIDSGYGIKPCIWMSGAEAYVYSIAGLLAKDYSGYDEACVTRDFEGGTIKYITEWNGDGTPKSFATYDMDQPNADKAMVFKSAGYYYGVSLIASILKNNYYSSKVTGETSHIDAQYALLLSSMRNTDNDDRVAFLLDGAYWEHEALQNGLFDSAVDKTGDDYFKYENRRFRTLACPKVDGQELGRATVGGTGGTYALVLKKVEEDPQVEQVAKLFYQFVFSDVGNAYYTQYTSLCRCLDYPIDRDKLSYFGGQVYDLYHSENTDVVQGLTRTDFVQENVDMLQSYYCIKYKGSNYDRQILEPLMNQGCTAKDYYEGLYTRQKQRLG